MHTHHTHTQGQGESYCLRYFDLHTRTQLAGFQGPKNLDLSAKDEVQRKQIYLGRGGTKKELGNGTTCSKRDLG